MGESARQNRELKKAVLDLTCWVGYLETVAKVCFSDQIKQGFELPAFQAGAYERGPRNVVAPEP
eukprot:1181818-Pyramimonas_sp.AAC.1